MAFEWFVRVSHDWPELTFLFDYRDRRDFLFLPR
jgi:hypothetical protein